MNSTILKSLLLTLAVLFNVFAFYTHIPTESLLNMHLTFAIAILAVVFIFKNNMVNLLLFWFILVMFRQSSGTVRIAFLPDIFAERIILVWIAAIFTFQLFMKRTRVLAITAAEIAMIAFSIYGIFSMIIFGTITEAGQGFSPGKFLNGYGFPFIIFFISKNIIDDESKIKKFIFFCSIVGIYLGITSIFEYFKFRQLIFPHYITRFESSSRSYGPFLDPSTNGAVMGMLLLVSIFLLLHENKRWKKFLHVIAFICLPVGILFTFTRSAWLSSFVGLLTVSIYIPSVRKVLFIISIIVIFFIFFRESNIRKLSEGEFIKSKASLVERIVNRFSNEDTIEGRGDLNRAAVRMFIDKPFFGHGYGRFRQARKEYGIKAQLDYKNQFDAIRAGVHNTLLSLLVDLGLTGLSLYLFITIYIVYNCLNLYIKLPRETFLGKDFIVVCTGMFLVYLTHIQFSDARFFLFLNSFYYCIAGILVGLNQRILRNEIDLSISSID